MKKQGTKTFRILLTGMLLVATSLTTPIASAQDGGNVVQILNQIAARIDAIVSVVASYIFQPTPNLGATLTTNYTSSTTVPPNIVSQVKTLNDVNLRDGLSPSANLSTVSLLSLTKNLPASDTVVLVPAALQQFQSTALSYLQGSQSQSDQQQKLAVGNENFNYQALMSYPNFTTAQQNNALNFIKTIADMATPISKFSLQDQTTTDADFKALSNRYQQQVINNVEASPKYQAYQAARRTLLAQQSAGLSNLYYLYAKRVPIPNIAAGDTALGTPNPSAQQIEDYIFTWRTMTPTWYQQMSTAAPATVARETLFVLVEIERALNNLHHDNMRFLSLSAINQLQTVSGGKRTLSITEPQILKVYQDEVARAKKDQQGISTPAG